MDSDAQGGKPLLDAAPGGQESFTSSLIASTTKHAPVQMLPDETRQRFEHSCLFCTQRTQWICFGQHAEGYPYSCCTFCAIPSADDVHDGKSALERSESECVGVCPACVLKKAPVLSPFDPTAEKKRVARKPFRFKDDDASDGEDEPPTEVDHRGAAQQRRAGPSKKRTAGTGSEKVRNVMQ
jgi:hypothetical protein